MNNDLIEKALGQAREMQKNLGGALNKSSEQLQPLIQQSVKNAQQLQSTLADHAAKSGAIAQEHSQRAFTSLQEYIRLGSQAVQSSTAQARDLAAQMAEHSRKTIESATAAMGKKPEDADPH